MFSFLASKIVFFASHGGSPPAIIFYIKLKIWKEFGMSTASTTINQIH